MKRILLSATCAIAVLTLGACGSTGGETGARQEATAQSVNPSTTTTTTPPTTVPPKADPGDLKTYLATLFTMRANDQQGPAWDLLVPQQQAIVSRVKFQSCGSTAGGASDVSVSIVGDPYEEEAEIPGVPGTVMSTAATVRVNATAAGRKVTQNITVHLVDVSGEWRWILSADGIKGCS